VNDRVIPVGCIMVRQFSWELQRMEVTAVFAIFVLVIQLGSRLQPRWKTTV